MKIQSVIAIVVLLAVILGSGYYLSQSEEVVEAAPVAAPLKAPLSVQATRIEEVEAQNIRPLVDQNAVYEDEIFNYHLSYPLDWSKEQPSANVVIFQSPDHTTRVKIEAVGPLPAAGLAAFVDRSLGHDILISRQLLTLSDNPAERVIVFSHKVGGQVTSFYVDAGTSAYVISGVGEQAAIEMMARSFNTVQQVAQR
ncbi:MAG: hypothetical protein BroJett011_66120 [Chloroflexota bacterium]|nr:MAG: hypothetical protein BroJett011_66120 [Chloroflexota bacterium]